MWCRTKRAAQVVDSGSGSSPRTRTIAGMCPMLGETRGELQLLRDFREQPAHRPVNAISRDLDQARFEDNVQCPHARIIG
jgi:hypothetical protein